MSPIKTRHSFKKTVVWTFVLLMIFFVALRLTVFGPQQEKRLTDALLTANQATLAQLADGLVAPMLQRKFAAVYATLDSQLEKANWREIRLVGKQGLQIYPLEPWQPLVTEQQLMIQQPIHFEGADIGRLELVLDFSEEVGQLRDDALKMEALQAGFIAIGLGAMFFYYRRHIDEPIDQLSTAMTELTLHNFDYPLPEPKHRELADLVTVFASTRDELDRQQQHLRDLKIAADRANEAKSQFLSSMSHELRTPLNAVQGFGQLLQADPHQRLTAVEQRYVTSILDSGSILLALIGQILDLAQIEEGNRLINIESVNIGEAINQCMQMVNPAADRRRVRVTYQQPSDASYWVRADGMRLRQVLINLLSNAVKYNRTDGTGHVTITYQALPSNRLRVQISDNGLGIAREDQDRLFQRFERLHTSSTNIEGTGIGLFLCKELLQEMDGSIGAGSELGVGSKFWFELPLADASQESNVKANGNTVNKASSDGKDTGSSNNATNPFAANVDTASAAGPKQRTYGAESTLNDDMGIGSGSSLLYIDDSSVNLALIEALASAHTGLRVITSDTPAEGIRIAIEQQPTLILLDLRMPQMDGFEVLEQLKLDERTRDIPVIAYTASAMGGIEDRIAAAGFDGLLTKPVTLQKLLAELIKFL